MTSTTQQKRNYSVLTAGLFVVGLAACGGEAYRADVEPYQTEPAEGIPALEQPLTPLATACTFDGATGLMAVVVESGETAVLSKRSVDSAILANGVACGAATTTNLLRIDVTENGSAAGDETVVLDFLNGLFATGSASGVGLTVDLGGSGSDVFAIRGSSGVDRISVGATGIATNNDTNNDITWSNVDSLVFTLSDGNDVFTGQGGAGSGTVFTSTLTVYGGAGDDQLTGGDGNDTLNGGDGDDTIAGMAGDDTLNGDAGDDVFDEGAAASGNDVFDGGADVDLVDYSARTATLAVSIGAGVNDGDATAGETDDVKSTVEGVEGGSGDDVLTGDSGDNSLYGNGGNDTITGGDGDDILDGGDGSDTFDEGSASNGADVITCGTSTDTVDYSARTNALTVTMQTGANDGEANEGDDVKSDCDYLLGGAGADTITGNNLANIIDGRGGNDVIDGGAGNDIFRQGGSADGNDTLTGGIGDDLVDYSQRSGDLTVTMGDGLANDGESGETDNVGSDVEWIDCGSGDDNVTGNDANNSINLGDGADTAAGGAGNDEIFGGAGDDNIDGDAGDDTIDGGAGSNTIDCGAGEADIGWNGTTTACEL